MKWVTWGSPFPPAASSEHNEAAHREQHPSRKLELRQSRSYGNREYGTRLQHGYFHQERVDLERTLLDPIRRGTRAFRPSG